MYIWPMELCYILENVKKVSLKLLTFLLEATARDLIEHILRVTFLEGIDIHMYPREKTTVLYH